ncbi:hypothetical protein [Kribbella sp. NPDC004536]|uniref:hypothetical protein n=1 Tax=Kribbella sp. NPDC004536 TaxID=3364106 RepID=UPI003676BA9F
MLVKDAATGATLGGLTGRTSLGLWFVDLLYLPDELRGTGLGSRILADAEAEARRRGCGLLPQGAQSVSFGCRLTSL